jgi:beta-glucosidase
MGEEVVQIYFRDEYSSVTRPVKELASYRRIELAGDQAQTVSFEIPIEQLSFYDIQMQRCVEPGKFIWMAGGSSADDALITTSVEIKERVEYQP